MMLPPSSRQISRLLSKYDIKVSHILKKENIHMLGPIKDKLGLKVAGIYLAFACDSRT
jgi:hypothetical protein